MIEKLFTKSEIELIKQTSDLLDKSLIIVEKLFSDKVDKQGICYLNHLFYVRDNVVSYEENKEYILERNKQYREEHKEEIAEYHKRYHEENPHISFNATSKRRKKEENQGRGITKEQWYEMMCWFDWRCAYSNTPLTKEHRTIDHIIPLNNRGINEPWNCVPCFDSYNYQKNTNDMEEWYSQQPYFLEERLLKIYVWCEYAFNKWKPRRKGNKLRRIK